MHLCESKTISLSKMIETIENMLGKTAKIEVFPLQPGDVDCTFANISKAKKLLGYNPKTKFNTGIEKFIKWVRDN